MNTQSLEEIFGEEQLWLNAKGDLGKWIEPNELLAHKNFFAFGDDGGDKFVETFKNEKALLKRVQAYFDGNTGADFETHIYLIVANGVKQKTVIALVNDEN